MSSPASSLSGEDLPRQYLQFCGMLMETVNKAKAAIEGTALSPEQRNLIFNELYLRIAVSAGTILRGVTPRESTLSLVPGRIPESGTVSQANDISGVNPSIPSGTASKVPLDLSASGLVTPSGASETVPATVAPYTCTPCGRNFPTKASYNSHKYAYHPNRYACTWDHCPFIADTYTTTSTHLKVEHLGLTTKRAGKRVNAQIRALIEVIPLLGDTIAERRKQRSQKKAAKAKKKTIKSKKSGK